MAITGNLEEASLPDVLQLLSLARKTGCLSLTDEWRLGRIYVENGRVTHASVINRPDRLGDLLVKVGTITPEQLQEAIVRQGRQRDRRLGEILLELGRICRADLEQAVRAQIEEAVYTLLAWTRGRFTFQSGLRPDGQEVLVSLNPESLMLEGARRIDEWSVIEKRIPSFQLVFELAGDRLGASGAELTADQRDILDLIDGERDVSRIVEDSGGMEFDVAKALYGLVTAGFARPVGRSDAARRTAHSRYAERKNLGKAFYRAGMLLEARREFQHLIEFEPADQEAYFHLGLVAVREERWADAIRHLEQASKCGDPLPSVLHNLALCYEQVGRLQEAEATAAEAAAVAADDARIVTEWGIVALQRGDVTAAVQRLDHARVLAGDGPVPALWSWARSLAAARAGDTKLAERLLRQGLEEHPRHPVLRNNLAMLLEMQGELGRAEALLAAALEDDPLVPQLSKNIGDIAYRRTRYDDAWDAYQRAIRIEPHLGDDVYFKLGNIAFKRGLKDLARQFWDKALELNPEHSRVRENLADMAVEPVGVLPEGAA